MADKGQPRGNPLISTGSRGLTPQQAIVETDRTPTGFFFRWLLDLSGRIGDGSRKTGTVTSVALDMPPEFVVDGSPVTDEGTFEVTKAPEHANYVWAGPEDGSDAPPVFRRLVAADIPAGGGSAGTWAEEIPAGTLNSVNTTFTLTHAPVNNSLTLFLNIVQCRGKDFTLAGNTITFAVAPKFRDTGWFQARYQY